MGWSKWVFCASRSRRPPTLLAPSRLNFATMSDLCPVYAPFFGAMVSFVTNLRDPISNSLPQGCTSAIVFTCMSLPLSYIALFLNPYSRYWSKASSLASRVFMAFATGALNPKLIVDFALQLWDRKIWCWHFSHGCIKAGSHDEERRSCHHGWYYRREFLHATCTVTAV
jgi:hypothetical protein